MMLTQPGLDQHLKKGCAPVYLIVGTDPYLFQNTITRVKQAWRQQTQSENEETIVDIHQAQQWAESFQDANTYSLFSEFRLLDLRYTKKTLDAASKKALQSYLDHPNKRTLVLIQAPDLPIKALQTLTSHPHLACLQITPYNPAQFKKFILQQLQTLHITYAPEVPETIYQYHQANLLACNQFLELLACMHPINDLLSLPILMTYLRDQSEFSIYELGEACLNGQSLHAIHILRNIKDNQGEAILVLWILSQEIRKIVQIHHLSAVHAFQEICQQLKIWSQKVSYYQKAWQRISAYQACTLLKRCQSLDEQMKSGHTHLIWQELEQVVMLLAQ